jgi:hypothetical protein
VVLSLAQLIFPLFVQFPHFPAQNFVRKMVFAFKIPATARQITTDLIVPANLLYIITIIVLFSVPPATTETPPTTSASHVLLNAPIVRILQQIALAASRLFF